MALGLLTFITVTAFGQHPGQENRKEVRNYIKDEVLPVVVEQRVKFEASLTQEERNQIDELRQRMESLNEARPSREERQQLRKQGRDTGDRPELTEEQKQQRREHMKERRKIMMATFEIADNHEDDLELLFDEIEDERQQWRSDLRAMAGDEEKQRGRFGHRGGRMHGGPGFQGLLQPAGFILMDPANVQERFGQLEKETSLYPNPASNLVNLEFNVPKREIVAVTLYDDKGTPIQVISNAVREKGKHKLSFDIGNLESGTYYYEIQGTTISERQRVIKQ